MAEIDEYGFIKHRSLDGPQGLNVPPSILWLDEDVSPEAYQRCRRVKVLGKM
jgi:hypothetical protein